MEPSHNNVCTHKSTLIKNNVNESKENNENEDKKNNANENEKLHIIIETLNHENICLRRIIKSLKFHLRVKQVPKKKVSKTNKKKIIQNLIDEQKLHPVAKAMINLQLHTPNAPYTDEERILSQQFFYYSAAALRRLRKAGCNFPAERTIRRWHEEYNMMPGFCEFIFCKLQKKFLKYLKKKKEYVL